jgi:hypothetical protein
MTNQMPAQQAVQNVGYTNEFDSLDNYAPGQIFRVDAYLIDTKGDAASNSILRMYPVAPSHIDPRLVLSVVPIYITCTVEEWRQRNNYEDGDTISLFVRKGTINARVDLASPAAVQKEMKRLGYTDVNQFPYYPVRIKPQNEETKGMTEEELKVRAYTAVNGNTVRTAQRQGLKGEQLVAAVAQRDTVAAQEKGVKAALLGVMNLAKSMF